jgi:hypothetical protein
MATYTCDKCGMSVNMTCARCDQELVHGTIAREDGSTVAVSKCPEEHGMIKSPMCCAQDMACAVSAYLLTSLASAGPPSL